MLTHLKMILTLCRLCCYYGYINKKMLKVDENVYIHTFIADLEITFSLYIKLQLNYLILPDS